MQNLGRDSICERRCIILLLIKQNSWGLFRIIWHLHEIFTNGLAIDERVLSLRDWTLASLIWKTSRVSMRTRCTHARNYRATCKLASAIVKKDSTWINHSKLKILPNWKMWSTVNTTRKSLKHLARIAHHAPSLRSFGSLASQVRVEP